MKIFNTSMLLSIAGIALTASASAQTTNTDSHTLTVNIPEVAMVGIQASTSKNITLGFDAPSQAGDKIIAKPANSDLWLNYSSIKSTADATRNISVEMEPLIPGVDVNLSVAAASGSGGGTLGVPGAEITLSTTPTSIISGIGSAYTGVGVNNGHNLTYSLVHDGASTSATDYANLIESSTIATVTYTISDN